MSAKRFMASDMRRLLSQWIEYFQCWPCRRRAAVIIAAVLVVLAAVGARVVLSSRNDSLAQIQARGVLRIGYAVEAPYAYITPDGQVMGLDPELARAVAQRLGIPRVEWRLAEFGTLIDGLNNGRFDLIAAGLFVTPERRRLAAFSLPTLQALPALLVQKGNPRNLHSYADAARDALARVAVLSGSVEEGQFLRLGLPAERLLRAPDARSAVMLVDASRADALALSAPTLRWMVQSQQYRSVELADPFDAAAGGQGAAAQRVAFAFRKRDEALLEAWNRELGRFLGSDAHLRLLRSHGLSTADLPETTTNPDSKEP